MFLYDCLMHVLFTILSIYYSMDLKDHCSFCRDFFEDELRAFQGAEDGFLPCVWDIQVPAFAQVGRCSQEFVFSFLS